MGDMFQSEEQYRGLSEWLQCARSMLLMQADVKRVVSANTLMCCE